MPNHDLTVESFWAPGWAHNDQRDFCSFYRFPKNKTLAEVVEFSKLQKFLIHSEVIVCLIKQEVVIAISVKQRRLIGQNCKHIINGAKDLHRYLGR
ncbi:unnamed protein product [Callosobruchus maculatus]|uniref:Uncharacterized protein n=1 Tax=Callosobruchus maculatus TaxID=64391 RepID=A0A653BV32_CALMS|nr:unnamed protein product [Callosobruchus maculatus]